jgi:superfamily II DNA/RNA helicase
LLCLCDQALYKSSFKHFNAIQTQVFDSLYDNDDNVLVAAPPGSGKTVCAELALLRLFSQNPDGTAVYIAPLEAIANVRFEIERGGGGSVSPIVLACLGPPTTAKAFTSLITRPCGTPSRPFPPPALTSAGDVRLLEQEVR